MDGWKPIIPEADLLKAEVEVWKRNCETLTEEIDQTSRELHTVIEAKFGDSCLYDALRIVNRRFYARIQATDGGLAKIEQLGRELTIAKEKIAALEAENAALRRRLIVDKAMLYRALGAYGYPVGVPFTWVAMRKALEAALWGEDDSA